MPLRKCKIMNTAPGRFLCVIRIRVTTKTDSRCECRSGRNRSRRHNPPLRSVASAKNHELLINVPGTGCYLPKRLFHPD